MNVRGEGNEEVFGADNGCRRDSSFGTGVNFRLQEGRVVIESYPDAYACAYLDSNFHSGFGRDHAWQLRLIVQPWALSMPGLNRV